MTVKTGYVGHWTAKAHAIAIGTGKLNISDLKAIYSNLDLGNFKPEFLPNDTIATGSDASRYIAILRLAQKIFGLSPEDYSNSDMFPELLLQIIATTKLVHESDDGKLKDEAIIALNITLAQACAKGRTHRTVGFHDNRSINYKLQRAGIVIGSEVYRYLSYPETNLLNLFFMLTGDSVSSDVYKI